MPSFLILDLEITNFVPFLAYFAADFSVVDKGSFTFVQNSVGTVIEIVAMKAFLIAFFLFAERARIFSESHWSESLKRD